MRTSTQKQSLGGGYGTNRGVSGSGAFPASVPPMRNTRVTPGSGYSRSAIGQSGKKHFQGAKVISGKK